MAVATNISLAGIVSPRFVDIAHTGGHPAIETETPPETPPPVREADRDLSQGLGPLQQRRVFIQARATESRKTVAAEATTEELDAAESVVTQIRDLAVQAQEPGRSTEERREVERQARELAQEIPRTGVLADTPQRPDVAVFAAVAQAPQVGVSLSELASAAADGERDIADLEARANAAIERIQFARERIPQLAENPIVERPQDLPEDQTQTVLETRERIQSPEDASRVAQEVRQQTRANSGEFFLSLANLFPQNVLALVP